MVHRGPWPFTYYVRYTSEEWLGGGGIQVCNLLNPELTKKTAGEKVKSEQPSQYDQGLALHYATLSAFSRV